MNLRFTMVVITSWLFVSWAIPWSNHMIKHKEKYSLIKRYKFAQLIMRHMKKRARTKTLCYGTENLPEDGGYILYANHQGKYDALGILLAHEKSCGVLWEEKSADRILARQVVGLIDAETISFTDVKDQIKKLNKITEQVKDGRRFLIFPEGGYTDNKNRLQDFKFGCFMCSLKSKTPVVPVAIFDSWKSMDANNLKKVTTQVHFLKPISEEEYKGMKKKDLCELVKERIQDKLNEIECGLISRDEGIYI